MNLKDGPQASRTPMCDRSVQAFTLEVVIQEAVVLATWCIAENTADTTEKEYDDGDPHAARSTSASATYLCLSFIATLAAKFKWLVPLFSLFLFKLVK